MDDEGISVRGYPKYRASYLHGGDGDGFDVGGRVVDVIVVT